MQIAKVASVLERKAAPPPVLPCFMRTTHPGKQNRQLPDGFGSMNHVAVRRYMDSTFDGAKKEIQVIDLRVQAS